MIQDQNNQKYQVQLLEESRVIEKDNQNLLNRKRLEQEIQNKKYKVYLSKKKEVEILKQAKVQDLELAKAKKIEMEK